MGSPSGRPSRYEPLLKLAAGGMATVYLGAARGALGFMQLVAIKKPHAHLVDKPDFKRELIAEARLASLLHHSNVVDVRDVEVAATGEISLIMDYVEGASMADLIVAAAQKGERLPPAVVVRIVLDALAGLHAAHELHDERGRPIGLVHRDVSPQNILVGTDGVSRVADFGVAKLTELSTTHGTLKGKLGYMAPEYLRGEKIDRRFDLFAMGIILWEALAGQRLFKGSHEGDTFNRILGHEPEKVSRLVPSLGAAFDTFLDVALAKSREERFDNALAMASALEACARAAGLEPRHADVASEVTRRVGPALEERRAEIRKKLSKEPSLISLMAQPGSIPLPHDTKSPPTVPDRPAVTVPEPKGRVLEVTRTDAAQPAPAPYGTLLSEGTVLPQKTLPLAGAQAAVSAPVPTETLLSEPSRGYEPVEIPGAPRPSGMRSVALLGIVAGLFVVAGGVLALRAWSSDSKTQNAPVTSVPAAVMLPDAAAPPLSASSVVSTTLVPSAKPSAAPRPHAAATVKTAGASGAPPPNPYSE